jgi:bifunctional DNase/RNase
MNVNKIELEIVALSHSVTQSHSYAVVLGEVNGVRRIPIVIGGFEAQAIAVALERMNPSRPLTHDLMKNMMVAFGVELEEVIIYKLEEGIFFSKLICQNADGKVEIDSRTSDALALAARFDAPIFTNETILTNAGLLMDDNLVSQNENIPIQDMQHGNGLSNLSMQELEERLNEVLENEDYIQAATIRDEINNRKKK